RFQVERRTREARVAAVEQRRAQLVEASGGALQQAPNHGLGGRVATQPGECIEIALDGLGCVGGLHSREYTGHGFLSDDGLARGCRRVTLIELWSITRGPALRGEEHSHGPRDPESLLTGITMPTTAQK